MKIKRTVPPKAAETNTYHQLLDCILKDIDDFEQENEGQCEGILTERTGNKIRALFPDIADKYFEV